MSSTDASHAHHEHELAHVASSKSLLATFGALVVLTVLTVAAARLNLGNVDLVIAMVIATIKATLVALFFMHLRHERTFNVVVFLSAFAFVSIFIGFALMDTSQYAPTVPWEQTLQVPEGAGGAAGAATDH